MKKKERIRAKTCVYNTGYHLVWSTKYRWKVLPGQIAETVEKIFYEIARIREFTIQHRYFRPNYVHC